MSNARTKPTCSRHDDLVIINYHVLAGSGIDEFFVLNLQLHEVATGKNISTYLHG
jgi:hypothetical protein